MRFVLAAALMTVAAVSSAQSPSAPPVKAKGSPARPAPAAVERGRYLVTVAGCHDCHTPKKMGAHGPVLDESRILSGHPQAEVVSAPAAVPPGWMAATNMHLTAWSGPWGVSFTFNLTPDENTGIGSWSEETFVKALRTGRHMGVERPILPPMPWEMYAKMTDADLKAVYAYLRSIPAISNRVPEPLPPAGPPPGAPAK